MTKFYLVYVVGERMPQFQHSNYQSALNEARRLSELTQKEVVIFEPYQSVTCQKFIIKDLNNSLPF